MKNIFKILSCGLLLGSMFFSSCEDLKFGNAFLDKPESDDFTLDSVFSKKIYADQALNQFYKSLYDYMPSLRGYHAEGYILELYTDIGFCNKISWFHGNLNSSSPNRNLVTQLSTQHIMGDPTYGIRKAYIYLENVDRVPDMTAEEKKIRKAEAKVVIGLHYSQMIRYWGGMPWIDHAYTPNEIFKGERLTLEETVNRTCNLLDEAALDLPWYTSDAEYGHMTAAAAKAIKFRLLAFVASPLFNNDAPYYPGEAADAHLCWYGDYQRARWERALEAGKEFIQLNRANGNHYRIENTGNPREDYINGYWTKGNQEVVMASFRWPIYSNGGAKPFRMYEAGWGAPRADYADMFEWEDGSKFDWNNAEHKANPFFNNSGEPTRDIRLYETLVVNGDKWQNRKAEVYNGGREGHGTGSLVGEKTQYGYGYRKFIRDKKNEMEKRPYSCPLFRMPELYLSMAEIMNHLGMAQTPVEGLDAYGYLNLVRNRAGMPDITPSRVAEGDDLLAYLLDERAREFGQEEIRYFDLIRYKHGDWIQKPLVSLTIDKNGSKFIYTHTTLDNQKYLWNEWWYLLPFPITEMNKNYGLVQNPGW